MATIQDEAKAERDGGESTAASRATTTRPEQTLATSEQGIKRPAEFMVAGFSGEALATVGAVVLAILGLADIYPLFLAPIAAIIISAGLLMKAANIASRFTSSLERETGGSRGTEPQLGAGMSMELLGGAAGIALGVLSLIGIVPLVLLPVVTIVFGGALLLGSGETYRVSLLSRRYEGTSEMARYFAQRAARAAASVEMLVGIGAVVLGIIALTTTASVTLSLVAFLGIAGVQLVVGFAESGRMASLLRS